MKRFLITSHVVFALVGIATTMLGPILPVLAQRWHLSDAQAGFFFIAQFLGGFVGSIVSTELVRRFSLHFTIRAGLLVTAAGVALVNSPLLPVALAAFAIYGIGIGFCSPTITAAVGEAASEQRASLLNLLNFVWTVGAISAPGLLSIAMERNSIGMTRALAILAIVLVPAAFAMPRVKVTMPQKESTTPLPPQTLALVVTTGVLIFLYVGIENGVAGWLPTFSSRAHHFSAPHSAALQATFWTALLAGRFGATGILRSVREKALLTVSIALALAGTAGVLLASGSAALYVSVAVVGLGCAPIFPTAIAVLSNSLAGQSGTKLGYMFAAAGLGGAVLPPCIGALSSFSSSLRTGMGLLLLAEVALLATHLLMSRMAGNIASGEKKVSAGM
jgi:MFS transporter, FHS family, glucose/mannose:H+ symporter